MYQVTKIIHLKTPFRLAASLFLLLFGCLLAYALQADFARLRQVAEARYGASGVDAMNHWEDFLTKNKSPMALDHLKMVNEFVNLRVTYADDYFLWGKKDYWETPLEAFAGGKGDCEDYALAKYVSLRLLGIPAEKLRLTYVKAKVGDAYNTRTIAHMVLSYYPELTSEPLILDSLVSDVLPASRRRDLKPIFSFNTEALWVTGKPIKVNDPSSRLSNWRDVVQRMSEEGLKW